MFTIFNFGLNFGHKLLQSCVKTHTYFGRYRLSCFQRENYYLQNMYKEMKHISLNVGCTFWVIREDRANYVRF